MASILVVCTGNVCRSPIAEGVLRAAFASRSAAEATEISSAGTAGWEGSSPVPESVQAAAERGIDISNHVARQLTPSMIDASSLVVCMARGHCTEVEQMRPEAAAKTFTLKEFVRLLEQSHDPATDGDIPTRVARADALRREGFGGNPLDEDVADPLGLPIEGFRAVAWELEVWSGRLAESLGGPLAVPAAPREA